MTTLIFITHPAVVIDRGVPIDQWPLSQAGLEDLSRLLQKDFWGSVDKIYSSSEPKASTVAETVSREKDIALTVDYKRDCLGEIQNRTFIEPSKFEDAVAAWYKSPNDKPNGRESVIDAQKRIVDCVIDPYVRKQRENSGRSGQVAGKVPRSWLRLKSYFLQ